MRQLKGDNSTPPDGMLDGVQCPFRKRPIVLVTLQNEFVQSDQIRLRMLREANGKGHLPALAFANICSSRPSTASELT